MQIPLLVSQNVTFDANGSGTVSLAPTVFGSTWNVKRISVSTSSGRSSTILHMYLNTISPASQLDATYSGDQDTSETDIHLQTLDRLYFVWTNGVAGATGTVVLSGTIETGR